MTVFQSPQVKLEAVTRVYMKKVRGKNLQRSSSMLKTLCPWGQWSWLLAVLSGVFIWDLWVLEQSVGGPDLAFPHQILRLQWIRRPVLVQETLRWSSTLTQWAQQTESLRSVTVEHSMVNWKHSMATLILPKDTAMSYSIYLPHFLSYCLKANLCEVFVSSHLFPLTARLRWM